MSGPNLHYFCISMQFGTSTGSVYIGYDTDKVTMDRLAQAKRVGGMHPKSVILAVSYLGYMTSGEMEG